MCRAVSNEIVEVVGWRLEVGGGCNLWIMLWQEMRVQLLV